MFGNQGKPAGRTCAAAAVIVLTAQGLFAAAIRDVEFFNSAQGKQSGPLHVVVPHVDGPFTADGVLNEPAWEKAAKVAGFLDYVDKSKQATEKSEFRIAYTDSAIVIAVIAEEPGSDKMEYRGQTKKDVWGGPGMIELFFDPSNAGKKVLHVIANPIGTRYDETFPGGRDWQGRWKAMGKVEAARRTIEFIVPFSDCEAQMPKSGDVWGLNIGRCLANGRPHSSWTGHWSGAATFGMAVFGSKEKVMRAEIDVFLDRETYDPLENQGVGVVNINPLFLPIGDLRVDLTLKGEDGARVESLKIDDLKDRDSISFALDLDSLAQGAYVLHANLSHKARGPLSRAECAFQVKPALRRRPSGETVRIPLNVWRAEGAESDAWAITTGIPLDTGVINSADNARLLDATGNEVPAQFVVRSRWSKRGSVRWLGIDFDARVRKAGAQYVLETGKSIRRAPVPAPLTVEDAAGEFRVDTGPLQFVVKKQGFNLLDSVVVDGRKIVQQESGDGLYVVDHEGSRYDAAFDKDVSVQVEEQGPVKVVIRAEGWYVKPDAAKATQDWKLPTDKLCRHITRITAYRGKRDVQVQHVWIMTASSSSVRLRDIGIVQRSMSAREVMFGLDGKTIRQPTGSGSLRLYQQTHQKAFIESGDDGEKVTTLVRGKRSDGYFAVLGADGYAALSVRDIWQMYPKELEVLSGNRMVFHIWPGHGRVNPEIDMLRQDEIAHCWWALQGRELNFTIPEEVILAASEYLGGKSYAAAGRLADAMGVGIEHNLLLSYGISENDAPAAVRKQTALYQQEPHAFSEPAYSCATGVFGPLPPLDRKRNGPLENRLETSLKLYVNALEYARDFGMWYFGDMHSDNSHFSKNPNAQAKFVNYRKYQNLDRPTWGLDRVWDGNHHGLARFHWWMYARTGDPLYLKFARRNSRHIMNVRVIQYHDGRYVNAEAKAQGITHRLGAKYHVKGFAPWGGDSGIRSHFAILDFCLYDYYMRGNHRALEVMQLWIDAFLREGETFVAGGRDTNSAFAEVIEYYKHSYDPRILTRLKQGHRILFGSDLTEHDWGDFNFHVSRWLLFGRHKLTEQAARKYMHQSNPKQIHHQAMAALYFRTGDKSIVSRYELPRFPPEWNLPAGSAEAPSPQSWSAGPKTYIEAWFIRFYGTMMSMPYQAALYETHK